MLDKKEDKKKVNKSKKFRYEANQMKRCEKIEEQEILKAKK